MKYIKCSKLEVVLFKEKKKKEKQLQTSFDEINFSRSVRDSLTCFVFFHISTYILLSPLI